MSDRWTLDTFTVETTTEGHDQDILYANGMMQVLVVVTLRAVNDDNTPHALTDDELSSLELIDCDGPPSNLSGGWTYSTTENIYDHTISPTAAQGKAAVDLLGPDKQRYWVSTSKAEAKTIGASIKVQDGSVVDTSGSGTFDSTVNITGRRPIDVLFEDLVLWQDPNTANGHIGSHYTYDQDNYYITFKDKQSVRFLDCSGFDGGSSDPYLYRSIGLFSNNMPCYIWYWWPVGPEKVVTAGCRDVNVNITINQEKDAACLTRLLIDSGPNIWHKHYRYEAKFTVYDQYGNSCVFYPKWTDIWNTLELSKSKTDD
ncbi:hypothetical protein ACQKWADRAFT_286997 [Trichoderma austrokoningii]